MMRAPTVRGFQRTPSAGIFNRGRFSPLRLPNLAAWYDLGPTRQASTTSNDIRIDASNRVSLIADRSGNSGVNCLCLNDASGNWASSPDSAAVSITGPIDLRGLVRSSDYTLGDNQTIVGKIQTDGQSSYDFLFNGSGSLVFRYSPTGTFAAIRSATSSVSITTVVSDFGLVGVRATYDSATGNAEFFYRLDSDISSNSGWTQLGTAVAITAGTIFDGTNVVGIGGAVNGTAGLFLGQIYRAQIYNGIAGTLAFDANFALAGKLVSSFTESSSNAATVTINSSGDLGARICGERDLVQLTASKQPIYTAATATTPAFITFDGTDDYMKAAAFSLSQPETVYFVGQQVSWTSLDVVYDGGATGEMQIEQITGSPQIRARTSANTLGTTSDLPLGATGVVSSIYNGASSRFRVNRLTAVTGTLDSNAANGFTLGSRGDAIRFANQRTNEIAVYAAAHDTATQDRFALYAASKWRISGV